MGARDAGDAWAPLAGPFVDRHYGLLRGRVRTEVIHHQLGDHLAPPPVAVVDVGGGAGNQSVPLAQLGYAVTIADPSPAMLERARRRLADEPPEVAGRVTLVEVDGRAAPSVLGAGRFGAVLCHGVLPYVEEPAPFVGALGALAAPGGVVSVVAKNARSLALRPGLRGRWAEARAGFDQRRSVNGLGVETRADTVEEVSHWLEAAGATPVAWYGVRLFTDATDEPLAPGATVPPEVLAAELEAARRDPYRQLSRLFHVVALKGR